MRKAIVISGLVILVAAAAFLGIKYFPSKSEAPVIQTFSTKQNPAFRAVPQKSSLIIEVKNQEGFLKALNGEKPIFAALKGIKELDQLCSGVNKFRDFCSSHSGIGGILKGKSIIISFNSTGKNQLTILYLVQLNDASESNSAIQNASRELGSEYTISRKTYDNTTIYNAKSDNSKFFFACSNDIFMVCEDYILIEDAIRHAGSQTLLDDHEFTEAYKKIDETALANIFINHKTIPQLLGRMLAPEIRKTIGGIDAYSNWSCLDLSAKASDLALNGYSVTKDSCDNYLNAFHDQESKEMTIDKAIPANASFFVALNIKNTSSFLNKYETYVKANGDFYARETNLIDFKKKTDADMVRLIKEFGANQYAGVYTKVNKSDPTQNRFFVAELTNALEVKGKLEKAVTGYGQTIRTGISQLHSTYSAGSEKSFDIYQLPLSNMAESLFGKAFAGINGQYFTIYDKYLVWGDNLPALKNYLQNLVSTKTMANDSIYKAYNKQGLSKPNFYMYAKLPKVLGLKDLLLNPEMSAAISGNEEALSKFSTFSWQFAVEGDQIRHRINLRFDASTKEEPQSIWQLHLEDQFAQKPKFVLNNKDLPNREVVVCDQKNNVYLISKDGAILWTMNIPGDIISEIHQIDLYHNNKFQYMFNTKSKLYIVDRTGKNVGKYPVSLKATASNGVTIAQYGNDKEYRFFIAGEDRMIYAYDHDGSLIPKWSFSGSESVVSSPVSHFDIDGKDYIVFADKKNTYFLDRQGKSREIQSASFDRSANPLYFFNDGSPRLITTDQSGKVHIQDFSGQEQVKEVGKFGSSHRFVAADLDGNGSPEYIFTEGKKLAVYGSDGKLLFEHSFPDAISEMPCICSYGTGTTQIGITLGDNKIYLLDKNGKVIKGFPLDGDTSFSLGKFNDGITWYNLIVGGNGNNLLNYRID